MATRYRQKHIQSTKSYSALLLYTYSLPYLFAMISRLINGEFFDLLLISAVFLAILIASVWMSVGLKNKSYYAVRKYPNTTPFPMMFLASLIIGGSSFVASLLLAEYAIFAAIGFGLAAMIGCWLWYGLDPVKSKHISFTDVNDADIALKILQDSETLVINIEKSTQHIDNNEMSKHLIEITSKAREVLNVLYQNPQKINKARRFLKTYLRGAESVVERYAATHKKADNQQLEENFKEVLVNIEQVFSEQHDKLISSDVFDLDVDIEVLNTLLKKQGIS
ncbi:MAG: 5-bromo-4-chloroindolyl phosphate hydrolysis family protein [Alcanivoracaceae bacterium]|nr:5-bromo-4-chloroindolyl phosphate hydrolysis family protein [Alcanivoracaceae bacterium]